MTPEQAKSDYDFRTRLLRAQAIPPPEVGELWIWTQEGTEKEHPFLVIEVASKYVKLWHIHKEYVHTDYSNLMRIDTRWRHEA